jgi:predicted N-acyltransferase
VSSIDEVGEAAWRAVEPPDFPFFDFEFLRALERSRSVGRGSGWNPAYLICTDAEGIAGALCTYLKTDSYGEYIFDWEWAMAYREHGLDYYPKLTAAVPFTPATGPKLLLRPGADRNAVTRALLDAAKKLGDERRVSSTHALFVPEPEVEEFARRGFAVRHSLQFHWHNRGYSGFDDYLAALVSKRRRQISRERRDLDEDLRIERLTGEDLKPHHAETMYRLYLSTSDRKWGVPYLREGFFEEVFQTMADRTLLVLAHDGSGEPVAGALNFFKGDALFGRYWGCFEDRRNLHFELCYYQEIEFAVEREMRIFEAGAQGHHKHARGFAPSITYSAHDIRHPAFRDAIDRFLEQERELVEDTVAEYDAHDPYKS